MPSKNSKWTDEEDILLRSHLDVYRNSNKNERLTLLKTTALPQLKKLRPGISKDRWKLLKAVSCLMFGDSFRWELTWFAGIEN